MKTLMLTAGISSLVFATIALAQDEAAPPPSPPPPPPPVCETAAGFADFDFWVGEWNVYSNDEARTFQGTNSITKHYNDCLVKETWQGAGGGGGFSINYFNPVKDEWRQVWVANGYSIDYTGGLNEDGAMVLVGEIYGYTTSVTTPFRGIWSANEDSSVVQHFDIMNTETNEWGVWFEGLYVRQEDDPNPPE